jgi:DNA-binding NarL/FixJ family response regulator
MTLTPRQKDLIRLLCDPNQDGYKRIAYSMGLSAGTVKVYMGQIFRRLGIAPGLGSSRQLVLWAIANRDELGIELPQRADFDFGRAA